MDSRLKKNKLESNKVLRRERKKILLRHKRKQSPLPKENVKIIMGLLNNERVIKVNLRMKPNKMLKSHIQRKIFLQSKL